MIGGQMRKRDGKLLVADLTRKQFTLRDSGQRIVSEFAAL
jgi:hypothetical protein